MNQAQLLALFEASPMKAEIERELEGVHELHRGILGDPLPEALSEEADNEKYASSSLKQAFTLTRRAFVNDMRNPAYIMQWVLGIVMMLFMGMLYSYVDTVSLSGNVSYIDDNLKQWGACTQNLSTLGVILNSTASQANQTLIECGSQASYISLLQFARTSLLYQLLASMFFSEMPQVASVHNDRALLFREHASRSYSSGAWIVSWVSRIAFAGFVKGLVFPPFVYFSAQLPILPEPYFLFCIFMGTMSMAGAVFFV